MKTFGLFSLKLPDFIYNNEIVIKAMGSMTDTTLIDPPKPPRFDIPLSGIILGFCPLDRPPNTVAIGMDLKQLPDRYSRKRLGDVTFDAAVENLLIALEDKTGLHFKRLNGSDTIVLAQPIIALDGKPDKSTIKFTAEFLNLKSKQLEDFKIICSALQMAKSHYAAGFSLHKLDYNLFPAEHVQKTKGTREHP